MSMLSAPEQRIIEVRRVLHESPLGKARLIEWYEEHLNTMLTQHEHRLNFLSVYQGWMRGGWW